MPRASSRFTKADVARALKAAEAAGFTVGAVEIAHDGTIRILKDAGNKVEEVAAPFDAWRASRDAH